MIREEIKNVVRSCNKREIWKFSLTMGIFLFIIGSFLFWKDSYCFIYFIVIAPIILISGLLFPVILKPFYLIWMSFAVVLGYLMTRIILTVIFCLLFIPVGFFLRIFRKDILQERFDRTAKSYWITREKKKFDRQDAERQF